MPFRLAIVITHPIQYYAPLFKLMAATDKLELKVFYTQGTDLNIKDYGFGKSITWDIPLLEGYEYEFLENTAKGKGSHHFKGIYNPDIINRIDHFQPNAILIYGWAYQSHLKVMRYFASKTPIWFRGDSTLLDKQNFLKSSLKKLYLRWVYKHVDHAFYVGSNSKAYFKYYGLKEQQLIFAPHAIDNDRFEIDQNREAAALRDELGIDHNAILILFAGKMEEKKDPLLLLNAFIQLRKENVHLLFVGNGVLEEELKTKSTQEEEVHNNIHFLDFQNQSQMPTVYQACDLFCLPSKGPSETWGLAINEAMAAGKAILASNKVGSAVDLVEEQKNGSIFIAGNINDLIRKLDRLTTSKSVLLTMGEHSSVIIKNWSLKKQSEIFINQINLAEQKL